MADSRPSNLHALSKRECDLGPGRYGTAQWNRGHFSSGGGLVSRCGRGTEATRAKLTTGRDEASDIAQRMHSQNRIFDGESLCLVPWASAGAGDWGTTLAGALSKDIWEFEPSGR